MGERIHSHSSSGNNPVILIDNPTRRPLPVRPGSPKCIIIHGSGETDLDRCLDWYTNVSGLQPHYFVTATGSVRRIVSERRVAYHAGRSRPETDLYRRGWKVWSRYVWADGRQHAFEVEQSRYRTWRDTWPGRESPLDLITGESANATSIGIEVQSLDKPTAEVFNLAQYAALVELVRDACSRWSIPIDREHILGHYDVSPLRRSGPSGGYDPGERFAWDRLFESTKEIS